MVNDPGFEQILGDNTVDQAAHLIAETFGFGLNEVILGETDDDIVASNIYDLLNSPTTVLDVIIEDAEVIGASVAIPIGQMDPSRTAESNETAYIYFTAIAKNRQGERLVGGLMEKQFIRLYEMGYRYAEEDCVTENGYADKVQKNAGEAIVETYDHNNYPDIGPQRFFRIDLEKATHGGFDPSIAVQNSHKIVDDLS
jgi:hypothetical protein